jgi:spore germination cell wall hydrolase CwlJ-like protein
MSVMRNRPKGARLASFGLGLCVFALIPTEVGYQDIASLLARQPGVAERWQKRVFASAVSTIQVATFSFGRPLGTATPQAAPYRLTSLDNQGIDITGSVTHNPLVQPQHRYQPAEFPTVDRTLKGDRLAAVAPEPLPAQGNATKEDSFPTNASVMGQKTAAAIPAKEPVPLDPELAEALKAPPLPQYDVSMSLEPKPLNDSRGIVDTAVIAVEPAPPRDGFSVKTASLFFGSSSLGAPLETMERWQPGEEPLIVMPGGADPDMKVTASRPEPAVDPAAAGESIASKGEVNSDDRKVKTPAERLGLLDEKLRAKQEKCLADAVYFEARGEAVRGQIAVAQVVMNRVFSGFYPNTVCGVVYQNSHRHLACQFTFACDGIRDAVTEPDMWERARKIARETLDGRLWLPEVGKSTHYHAYWVHPSWVHEMKKMYKFGVHTFYRPRAWGDGSEAPSWGTPAQTAEISAKLAEVKP